MFAVATMLRELMKGHSKLSEHSYLNKSKALACIRMEFCKSINETYSREPMPIFRNRKLITKPNQVNSEERIRAQCKILCKALDDMQFLE